ncbi:hypothetical protein [Streptomyces smyrnaeus]|uniref:hypothetical protein n=1 Tax=Streptomyces smyrnaeus TaxID=1387713 RepID=UPI0033FCD33F
MRSTVRSAVAAAAAGVLAVTAGACSSGEEKTPGKQNSPEKSSTAPPPPSRKQLKKMLLSKGDLPPSLKQHDKIFPVPLTLEGKLEASRGSCQPLADALDIGMPEQAHAWAKQRYAKAPNDRFTVSLASYTSEKEAAAAVGKLKSAAAACTSSFRIANKKAHYNDPYKGVKSKPAPQQGDQALAYDLQAVADDGSRREFPFLHIYVRVGNVVATVVRVGSDQPEDNHIPPDLVTAQVNKLNAP